MTTFTDPPLRVALDRRWTTVLGMLPDSPPVRMLTLIGEAVSELHDPIADVEGYVCAACDVSGYGGELRPWPCELVRRYAAALGIELTAGCPLCQAPAMDLGARLVLPNHGPGRWLETVCRASGLDVPAAAALAARGLRRLPRW